MSEQQPIDHQPEADKFDRNAQALSQGESFGIPQLKGESNDSYRERLSGVLRSQGKIIEAHEVYSGRRWDDPEQGRFGPMLGIMGAVGLANQGINFGSDGEHQVGDDIAAGVIVQAEEDPTKAMIRSLFDTVGPAVGMDIIDAMLGKDR